MALPAQLPLLPSELPGQTPEIASYAPLTSVWEGEDPELLEAMLSFYPHRRPERILDATVNAGRFWRGSSQPVIGLDIERRVQPTIQGHNFHLPFRDAAFDVVVYDPPHVPNQGRDREKDFTARFGLNLSSSKATSYNLAHLYAPFAQEAFRVLVPDGVLLCKIADYVHNHRLQWAHVDMVHAAESSGFIACDCIIKVRKGPIMDPKWRTAHHSRRRHAYWLIFRKSTRCE